MYTVTMRCCNRQRREREREEMEWGWSLALCIYTYSEQVLCQLQEGSVSCGSGLSVFLLLPAEGVILEFDKPAC